MFRDDFVWGVASSSYQVEGTDANDGRGKTVWDAFTEAGRIFENQNAYTTCDHMHHYKEDYALMKNLGIKAYRFSVCAPWARSNGCKSRTRPDSGKCIAEQQGCPSRGGI